MRAWNKGDRLHHIDEDGVTEVASTVVGVEELEC